MPVKSGPAMAHLAAVYLISLLTLPVGVGLFVILESFGTTTAGFGLLALLAASTGLFSVVGAATGFPPATRRQRWRWAASVTLGGTAGVIVAVWIARDLGVSYGAMVPWAPTAGVPYLLVAALFTGLRIRLVAIVALLALAAGGAYGGYAVRQTHRKAALGGPGPGHEPGARADPRPEEISCEPRGEFLYYRRGPGAHEYVRTVGATVVKAAASTEVDEKLLETAVLAARPMTMDELVYEIFER
ncbi:hypothetical protein [Actinoplanes sp. CA-252034]|uniref:hypothetical protein n=1 Tax=Actinoplanes sp. CA-252034 TaxID=3239906 RepID=UPI003D95F32D